MSIVDLDMEGFCSWLCERESALVREAGIWFGSPLALYLSEKAGRLYGIEGTRYGPASWPVWLWRSMPSWAQVFLGRVERYTGSLVGAEAFSVLAEVEREGYHAGI